MAHIKRKSDALAQQEFTSEDLVTGGIWKLFGELRKSNVEPLCFAAEK
jgi:hypothetical protein